MESDLNRSREIKKSAPAKILSINDAAVYYFCDSKLLNSSSPSVQIFGDNRSSLCGQNELHFCELDIIAKRERRQGASEPVPLHTVSDELKRLPMTDKIVNATGVFRKTVSKKGRKEVNENSSEVLCLANVLTPEMNQTGRLSTIASIDNDSQKGFENIRRKLKMKNRQCARSKSRSSKVKEKGSPDITSNTNTLQNSETTHFGDLADAKIIYFANLPNASASEDKNKQNECPITCANKDSVDKNKKCKKSVKLQNSETTTRNSTRPLESECNIDQIIINNIESDVPHLICANSQSSLTTKMKTNSELSVDIFSSSRKKSGCSRIHNNSPISDATVDSEKVDCRKKRRKKHVNTRKCSTDEEGDNQTQKSRSKSKSKGKISLELMNKEDRIRDTNKSSKDSIEKAKTDNLMTNIASKVSKECQKEKLDYGDENASEEHRKKNGRKKGGRQKILSPDLAKSKDSVLKIYTANKLTASESNTKVADEFFAKLTAPIRRSIQSRSRTPNVRTHGNSDQEKRRASAEDDEKFLKVSKDIKMKKRSKSRASKEKDKKSRNKRGIRSAVSRQRSRKSVSDLSEWQNVDYVDASASSEGKFSVVQQTQTDERSRQDRDSTQSQGSNYLNYCVPGKLSKKSDYASGTSKFPTDSSNMKQEEKNFWHLTKNEDLEPTKESRIKEETELIYTAQKDKWRRSKSCARKEYGTDRFLPISDDNKTILKLNLFSSSDVSISKELPKSKRSKSLILKERYNHRVSEFSSVSKEKLCEELRKLDAFQHINPLRKRFRVVSKPIHDTVSSSVNVVKRVEESLPTSLQTVGSNRLKPLVASEKEKEDILKLPIFRTNVRNNVPVSWKKKSFTNVSKTKLEEFQGRRKKERRVKKKESNMLYDSAKEDLSNHVKISRKNKLNNKPVFRREVSFSQLNLVPLKIFYAKPSRISTVRPDVEAATKVERMNTALGKTQKMHSSSYQSRKLNEGGFSDETDCSLIQRLSKKKLSCFHISSGEKILEISTKAIGTDGKTVIGFTVSGTEPPKQLRYERKNSKKSAWTKTCKLHMTFLSPIQLNEQTTSFEKRVLVLNYVKRDLEDSAKKVEYHETSSPKIEVAVSKILKESASNLKTIKSAASKSRKISVLFEHRRKDRKWQHIRTGNYRKKFISLKSLWSPEITNAKSSLKTLSKNEGSNQEAGVLHRNDKVIDREVRNEDVEKCKPKFTKQKQSCRNRSRIDHTLRLLESTLQIIKEESQSTDTSSRCSRRSTQKVSASSNDIKTTQTDLKNKDIVQMKEVINFLYSTMDQKKAIVPVATSDAGIEVKRSEKILQTEPIDSSETSSPSEQFKATVKNVKSKFHQTKQSMRANGSSKEFLISDFGECQNLDVIRCDQNVQASLLTIAAGKESSSGEKSTSMSDSKRSGHRKLPTSSTSFTPSPLDVTSKGYFEKYKSTKELIELTKKNRVNKLANSIKKCDKAVSVNFKYNSSESNSSKLIASSKGSPISMDSKTKTNNAIRTNEEKYVQVTNSSDKKMEDDVSKKSKTYSAESKRTESSKKLDKKDVTNRKVFDSQIHLVPRESFNLPLNQIEGVKKGKLKCQKFEEKPSKKGDSSRLNKEISEIYKISTTKKAKKITEDSHALRKSSTSSNSCNKAIIEKFPNADKADARDSSKKEKVKQKTPGKFERLRKVFGGKEESLLRNELLAYNVSPQKYDDEKNFAPRQQCPETDYMSFIKLERHLEQLLGLYPSIFKAIRAQVDNTTAKNVEKMKAASSDLFASKSTLATTVDTITEYKNIERCEKIPCVSDGSFSRHYSSHCCHCYHYRHNQSIRPHEVVQNFTIGQKRQGDFPGDKAKKPPRRKKFERRFKNHHSNIIACTDTTSTIHKTAENAKQLRKENHESRYVSDHEVYQFGSVSSVYSNGKEFLSSSSSSILDDKWSIASPLYGRTTISDDLSSLQCEGINASKSSRSLTISNKTLTTFGLRKSKSLIEMSTKKSVNRKLTLQQLLNIGAKKKNSSGLTRACAPEVQPSILLLTVSSSCAIFTTPSKFLAKVEKNLQFDQNLPDVSTKSVKGDNVAATEGKLSKQKVSEQSYHSILFPAAADEVKSNMIISGERKRPFYIHQDNESDSEPAFLDSLEVGMNCPSPSQQDLKTDDEDFGNFSADSLETINSKRPATTYDYSSYYSGSALIQPTNQTYLVYSNTVKYDPQRDDRSHQSASNPQKPQTSRKITLNKNILKLKSAREDTSNTLISESGYESTKSKRTASIRNFFKKGGSLLDMFRSSAKNGNKSQKIENPSTSNLTSFSNLFTKKHDQGTSEKKNIGTSITKEKSACTENESAAPTSVYWHSIGKQNEDKKDAKCEKKNATCHRSTSTEPKEKKTDVKGKCSTSKCTCADSMKCYKKQMDQCHTYAEKVLLESQLRKEGYYKQYKDFKEIPLELLIGKRIPCSSKHKKQRSACVQASKLPSEVTFKADESRIVSDKSDSDADMPKTFTTDEKIVLKSNIKAQKKSDISKQPEEILSDEKTKSRQKKRRKRSPEKKSLAFESPPEISPTSEVIDVNSATFSQRLLRGPFSRVKIREETVASHNSESSDVPTVTQIFKGDKRSRSKSKSKSRDRSRSKSKASSSKSTSKKEGDENCCPCRCDVEEPAVAPEAELPVELEKVEKVSEESIEEIIEASSSSSTTDDLDKFIAVSDILDEIVATAMIESDHIDDYLKELDSDKTVKGLSKDFLQLTPKPECAKTVAQQEPLEQIKQELVAEELSQTNQEPEIQQSSSDDFRQGLSDKEVFDKLLDSFEKEENIATRLSKDEEFFKDQIESIKKESEESLDEASVKEEGEKDPNDVIYSEDVAGDKHRSTHFWEEKMKLMRTKEDNPVKTDDIGTCFARGFRPDNIALSGDACFNLNKQDRLKFPKGMLTDEESIIDFSERETPLDYLLALGFMVDEASNALKDEDIRSRLLAAITEARVWINKITTTQGTLLYLVAYKSRPKTMRYFLQLVEAIINKRINNAIKLDGFLRVLEQVEEGEIQMINILGADKFEDEENEEKIVRKQLRQLFITVYKIAERESLQRGKALSQQAIVLLRILAAKYRAGLHPHLELIARYIGQELLNTETQLEAAMIFLSRLDTAEVKLKEFEAYCDIKCEKKKKKSLTSKSETSSNVDTK